MQQILKKNGTKKDVFTEKNVFTRITSFIYTGK